MMGVIVSLNLSCNGVSFCSLFVPSCKDYQPCYDMQFKVLLIVSTQLEPHSVYYLSFKRDIEKRI